MLANSSPRRSVPSRVLLAAAIFALISCASASHAQLLRRNRPQGPENDAIVGQPFGVGFITVELPPGSDRSLFGDREFTLNEKNNRAFYSAFDARPIRAALREALQLPENVLGRPQTARIYFLFTGGEPLDLTLYAPTPIRRAVQPRRAANESHAALLDSWWRETAQAARRADRNDEYPDLVDNYLLAMLSRRVGTNPDVMERRILFRPDVDQALGLLTGAESVRAAMQKETMLASTKQNEVADQPLPTPVAPPPVDIPEPAADVAVEPIALHVPHECFYVRFGSFANYQWFRGALDEWGGDLRTLIAFRGLNYDVNERLQTQLALRENALAKVLGPQVIADVALIGTDTFFREGPSIGMLFQAKSNFALASDFKSQRAAALKNNPGATETTVDIAGHKVAFLSTPDNRLRSFYAVDGDFHFVTTSRALVERFYQAGVGDRSLGESREFRFARTKMPLSRDDTLFAYLSDEFFRLLTGPRYRVEMTRRLKSATDIDLLQLARLAAANERRPAASTQDLIQGGFLPQHFARRADGSALEERADGQLVDTLRGAQGSFTPILDVEFDQITPSEARAYAEFARLYEQEWKRMDPVMLGLKRYAGRAADQEHLVLDVFITPVAQQHYGFLAGMLGPATRRHLAPIEGDALSLQVIVGSALNQNAPLRPGDLLFAGLRDAPIPYDIRDGEVRLGVPDDSVRLYLGGVAGQPLLRFAGLGQTDQFDAQGYAPVQGILPLRIQRLLVDPRRENPDLQVAATNRAVLDEVTSQLQFIDSERPAQLRLHVGDLPRSKLTDLVTAFAYFRARQVSAGNVRFMHVLSAQLGVPPEKARQVAEFLVDAKLICPLGGEYKLERQPNEFPTWFSTGWTDDAGRLLARVPQGFQSPATRWFRGLDLDFSLIENQLSAHVELDMQRRPQPAGAALELPTFSFPVFGGAKKQPAAENSPAAPETLPRPTPAPPRPQPPTASPPDSAPSNTGSANPAAPE